MGDFKNTRLWQTSLGPQGDQFDRPRDRLTQSLEHFRARAASLAGEISRDLPELTVHDITHIDALWETADIVVGSCQTLSPAEAFVLGGAFLIHDLGLGLAAYPGGVTELQSKPEWKDFVVVSTRAIFGRDPTSDEAANPAAEVLDDAKFRMLRKLHASQAEHLVEITWSQPKSGERYHLLEDTALRSAFGSLIGKIAHSHWWPVEELPSRFPTRKSGPPVGMPNEWTIDAIKLALLLRLADAAHLDGRRAPAFLRALRKPKAVPDLHWSFQDKLYQVRGESDKLVFTSRPFDRNESQAWWMCFDTLQMVDAELRRADDLNVETHRDRFAARGVRSAEDPKRLADLVVTQGWTPVDTRVRVGAVADLVKKLGGQQLYGDDPSVPLRELLQNSADAIRARRALEGRSEKWGSIVLSGGRDEYGSWLELEDNGVGMSAAVLTGPLLDFGASLWSVPQVVEEFPGLLSSTFRSIGRYGIGFFSLFMWSDRVRVTTRRFDEAVRDTRVLEFEKGLESRPLLRPADPSEGLRDGGTRARVWPRNVDDINSDWIRLPGAPLRFEDKAGPGSVAKALCVAMDVDVSIQNPSEQIVLAHASDWLELPGEELLKRVSTRFAPRGLSRALAGSNVRPLLNGATVVGRAAISPGQDGFVVVGGLRSRTHVSVAGILLGESTRASRDEARVLVREDELARWATEQAALILPLDLPLQVKAKCGRLIEALGGEALNFPIAKVRGSWVGFLELVEWSREQESIIVIDESDEDRAAKYGHALSSNVLIEPRTPDGLVVEDLDARLQHTGDGDRPEVRRDYQWRPVMKAVAEAWHPCEFEVWTYDMEIDEDGEIEVSAEEVKRSDS
jgi:hypothetical protein